jgi:hypothetical protein
MVRKSELWFMFMGLNLKMGFMTLLWDLLSGKLGGAPLPIPAVLRVAVSTLTLINFFPLDIPNSGGS